MSYDSRPETWAHIQRVRYFLDKARLNLDQRRHQHDQSKLVEPELSAFDIATPKLASLEYGSEEYKQSLRDLGPALQHHFRENDHHPEWVDRKIEWHPVAGFSDYEVSNMGDVRSVTREVERSGKQGKMVVNGRILAAQITPKGYLRIQLRRNTKSTNRFIHRLVAETFIPNPENKPQVNHKNGIKTDCRAVNLEWVTASENLVHAYENSLKEASVKYVFHCPDLDITAFGAEKMAQLVREHLRSDGSYEWGERVTSAGVWRAGVEGGKHFNLTFEATAIAEYRRSQIQGMSLMALIEMLCDWRAASERTKQRTDDPEKVKNFQAGLLHNKERFKISDDLYQILLNTCEELNFDDTN